MVSNNNKFVVTRHFGYLIRTGKPFNPRKAVPKKKV